MALLLKNTTFIDWRSFEFISGDILIGEGLNGKLIFSPEADMIDIMSPEIMDCSGCYVTRSFAIGHHHVYSALARGMPPPAEKPADFPDMLRKVWWRLDNALDNEIIKASALYTAMECALNGITFVIDHHASPNSVPGALETIAAAFEEAGIAHLLCYEISDRDGIETALEGLSETEAYLKKRQGLVGLHASFTISEVTLQRAVDLSTKYHTGIHVHTAEDLCDQQDCMQKYGLRVMERYERAGALALKGNIFAHCIHLDEKERGLLADAPASFIVQNPESNLKNGVGFLDPWGMGQNIMLGTDGMHSDVLRSAKAAFFAGQKYGHPDPGAIYHRCRNVHRYLAENSFTGDGENSLVVLDYDPPTEIKRENFLSHFIFGIESKHVRDVIANGKIIVRNRRLLTLDRKAVSGFAREMASKLWKRMEQY